MPTTTHYVDGNTFRDQVAALTADHVRRILETEIKPVFIEDVKKIVRAEVRAAVEAAKVELRADIRATVDEVVKSSLEAMKGEILDALEKKFPTSSKTKKAVRAAGVGKSCEFPISTSIEAATD